MFGVRAGVNLEDAQVHAGLYLQCASLTGPLMVEQASESGRGFTQATLHSVEMANALVDALLDSLEQQSLDAAKGR